MTDDHDDNKVLEIAKLASVFDSEDAMRSVMCRATDMAARAINARVHDDPSWWSIPGKPTFNEQMKRLRKFVQRRFKPNSI